MYGAPLCLEIQHWKYLVHGIFGAGLDSQVGGAYIHGPCLGAALFVARPVNVAIGAYHAGQVHHRAGKNFQIALYISVADRGILAESGGTGKAEDGEEVPHCRQEPWRRIRASKALARTDPAHSFAVFLQTDIIVTVFLLKLAVENGPVVAEKYRGIEVDGRTDMIILVDGGTVVGHEGHRIHIGAVFQVAARSKLDISRDAGSHVRIVVKGFLYAHILFSIAGTVPAERLSEVPEERPAVVRDRYAVHLCGKLCYRTSVYAEFCDAEIGQCHFLCSVLKERIRQLFVSYECDDAERRIVIVHKGRSFDDAESAVTAVIAAERTVVVHQAIADLALEGIVFAEHEAQGGRV